MRLLVALFALICLSPLALAQPGPPQGAYRGPDLGVQRAAMARLEPLLGRWQGQANLSFPEAMLVHQTEQVETDLDGLVLVIRGTGYATPDHAGPPVFQAMAVASFDDRSGVYEFRSYSGGRTITATGQFLPDGAFRWGFNPGGAVQIRYTIRFDANSWTEVGEMSRDGGATWTQTISLQLARAP